MTYIFNGLKPEKLWHYFYELNQLPRESKHEEQAGKWLVTQARELGLEVKRDNVGNVLVRKPATKGYENAATVCIQGHIDMVCEKNEAVTHDFRKDPIKMKIAGDVVTAQGTTLGADNGIGVAAGLALMQADDLVHPDLEFLFTVDEETGLTGASALEKGFLKAQTLLNCDSEEEGILYVGCAGGQDTEIKLELKTRPAPSDQKALVLKIGGLKGGHSGLDIHIGRANAIKQLNRVVWQAVRKFDIHVYHLSGGSKHNAIPREARCKLLLPEAQLEDFKDFINNFQITLQAEYQQIEKNIHLFTNPESDCPQQIFTADFQAQLLNLLYALPHGVMTMSPSIPDLVQTSTNLAVVAMQKDALNILTSQRSSVDSAKTEIADRVQATGELAQASVEQGGGYPGWNPNMDSPILKLMRTTYQDLFAKEPEVKAIHAGLETGIIGEKVPGIDMISFGPTIRHPHSPGEEVDIQSVEKFWQLLTAVLQRLAKK